MITNFCSFHFTISSLLTNCTLLFLYHLLFFLSLQEINNCVCGTLFILINIFVCNTFLYFHALCAHQLYTLALLPLALLSLFTRDKLMRLWYSLISYSTFYSCYYSAYNYRQFSYFSCLSYVCTRYVSFALFSLVTRDQLMLLWYYCLTIVLLLGFSIRQFKVGLLIITRNCFLINFYLNN